MTSRPLRIMLIGGDTTAWVRISSSLGQRSSQIFVPKEVSVAALRSVAGDIDVILVMSPPLDPDPCAPVRIIREAGLQRRTILMVDGDDQRTASEALALGIAGYVRRRSSPDHVANTILHVAAGGAMFDAPAAAVVHTRSQSPDNEELGGYMAAARALSSALELKDTYTGGHAERVTALAIKLARAALLEAAMPSESLEAAFLLHDVGKIGIPESILNKPSGLTDTERRVLNTHPILGERIVAPLGFPDVVRQVIRHHHERWDGAGYPDGLKGEEIPAAARVFAIADVVDAMTSIRPYRRPVSFERAVGEVMREAGKHFDPVLAVLAEEVFLGAHVTLMDSTISLDGF